MSLPETVDPGTPMSASGRMQSFQRAHGDDLHLSRMYFCLALIQASAALVRASNSSLVYIGFSGKRSRSPQHCGELASASASYLLTLIGPTASMYPGPIRN